MKKINFEDNIQTINLSVSDDSFENFEDGKKLTPYSITTEDLEERMNSVDTGTKARQIFCCFVVSLGYLSFGTTIGWTVAVNYQASTNDMYSMIFGDELTWMTSTVSLGYSLGFGFWSLMAAKNGPRRAIFFQTIFFVINWVFMIWWASPKTIIWARFFLGFSGVCYITAGQTMLNDCVHKNLYKYLRIPPQTCIIVGVVLIQILGILSIDGSIGLCILIPILVHIFLLLMPESPVYRYQLGENYAEQSLSWYQGKSNIYDSMRRIRNHYTYRRMRIEQHRHILYSKVVLKALGIILGVITFHVVSGYHLFLYYGMIIFTKIPIITPLADVCFLGVILIFAKLFCMIIHLRLNLAIRKPLICSCIVVASSHLMLAAILYYQDTELYHSTPYLKWLCFISCAINIFGYEMGLNYYPSILLYEYMPFQVFKTAVMLTNTIYFFLTFITMKCFGLWHSYFPNWILIGICSVALYIGALFVYFFVVEVKGRSLIQIQMDIGGNPIGNRGTGYLHIIAHK